MLHVVLVEPRIPQNTGNVARTCLAAGARLHLVGQTGFWLDDKNLRRAGMDYWDEVDVAVHPDLGAFLNDDILSRAFLFSTKGPRSYAQARFTGDDYLFFGREDAGLPRSLLLKHMDRAYKIPMKNESRSLNLATCVGIVVYEALRQLREV